MPHAADVLTPLDSLVYQEQSMRVQPTKTYTWAHPVQQACKHHRQWAGGQRGFSDYKQWASRQWAEGVSDCRQWAGRQWAEGFSDDKQWAGRQWAEGFSECRQWAGRQWAEGFGDDKMCRQTVGRGI